MSLLSQFNAYWLQASTLDTSTHDYLAMLTGDDVASNELFTEGLLQLKTLLQNKPESMPTCFANLWLEYVISSSTDTDASALKALQEAFEQSLAPYLYSKWNDFAPATTYLLTEGMAAETTLLKSYLHAGDSKALAILQRMCEVGFFSFLCYLWYRNSLTASMQATVHQGTYHLLYRTKDQVYTKPLNFPEQGVLTFEYAYDEFGAPTLQLEEAFKPWYLLRLYKVQPEDSARTTVQSYHQLLKEVSALLKDQSVRYLAKVSIRGATESNFVPWNANVPEVLITNSASLLKAWKNSKGNLDTVKHILGAVVSADSPVATKNIKDTEIGILVRTNRPEYAEFSVDIS